jgi:hypothetical protein
MAFKTDEVIEKLTVKFGFEKKRDTKHSFYAVQLADDLPVITTFFSHGGKEITVGIEQSMSKELHVDQGFFRKMITCTRDLPQYIEKLRTAPNPPFEEWMLHTPTEEKVKPDVKKKKHRYSRK